jgi:chemotaxis protein MotB
MAKQQAHHGGAWKVAYADFVTAMMALFMVLWISAQDKKILLATSKYFQQPFHSQFKDHSGIMPSNKELREGSGGKDNTNESSGQAATVASGRPVELQFLNSVAADFNRMLHMDDYLEQKPIDVQVTSDGLRVTLFDRARRPLFEGDSANLTSWGKFVVQNLAWLIDQHHFNVTIDGHTRSKLVLNKENYSAWELSSDRANVARRTLVYYAVDPAAIERVAGYADTQPIEGEPPESEMNQRITLSLSLSHKGNWANKNPVAASAQSELEPSPSLSPAPPQNAQPRSQ